MQYLLCLRYKELEGIHKRYDSMRLWWTWSNYKARGLLVVHLRFMWFAWSLIRTTVFMPWFRMGRYATTKHVTNLARDCNIFNLVNARFQVWSPTTYLRTSFTLSWHIIIITLDRNEVWAWDLLELVVKSLAPSNIKEHGEVPHIAQCIIEIRGANSAWMGV